MVTTHSARETKVERLASHIKELREKAKLDSWTAFITEMHLPPDLFLPVATGRTQLMPQGRALTAEECQTLYSIISALIDTNNALREHAQQTSIMVNQWVDMFKGLVSVGWQVEAFADFRSMEE